MPQTTPPVTPSYSPPSPRPNEEHSSKLRQCKLPDPHPFSTTATIHNHYLYTTNTTTTIYTTTTTTTTHHADPLTPPQPQPSKRLRIKKGNTTSAKVTIPHPPNSPHRPDCYIFLHPPPTHTAPPATSFYTPLLTTYNITPLPPPQ